MRPPPNLSSAPETTSSAARACINVRIGEFMRGNSIMKLPDAMHAGQEMSVRRGRGLAASAAPVVWRCYCKGFSEATYCCSYLDYKPLLLCFPLTTDY